MLGSWKVIGYSKKKRIEDVNIFGDVRLYFPEG